MRWCSRSAAGCISACFGASGRETWKLSGELVQAESSSARVSTVTNAGPRLLPILATVTDAMPPLSHISINKLDLLGRRHVDNRAVALLNPAANANGAAFKFVRLDAGGGKGAA